MCTWELHQQWLLQLQLLQAATAAVIMLVLLMQLCSCTQLLW
jgi:hypothetical protein